jgi:hypothetical protein
MAGRQALCNLAQKHKVRWVRFCHLTWSDLTERKHAGALSRQMSIVDFRH